MKLMALTLVAGLAASAYGGDCPGDCNGDGEASILDFVCFQGLFVAGDDAADCNGDGNLSILDFVCFQGAWQDFANGGCDGCVASCPEGGGNAYSDGFETYCAGEGIEAQASECGWETWDLAGPSVDCPVMDDNPFEGNNYLVANVNGDVVRVVDVNSGVWEHKVMTYVPGDAAGIGYMIALNTYAHGGAKDWSMQVAFDPLLGIVEFQDQAFEIALIQADEWVELRTVVDLDNDTVDHYYDGEQIVFGGNWSDGVSVSIQCWDYFSTLDGMGYDNASFQPVP